MKLLDDVFIVKFDTNGGSPVQDIYVENGDKIIAPKTNPTKDGFEFIGWYYQDEPFDFNTIIDFNEITTEWVTLQAKWAKDITKYCLYEIVKDDDATIIAYSPSNSQLYKKSYYYECVLIHDVPYQWTPPTSLHQFLIKRFEEMMVEKEKLDKSFDAIILPREFEYEGKKYPVKRIGDFWGRRVFEECHSSTVCIPDGYTEINNCSFADCLELTSVILPKSLKTIHSDAFAGCVNLKSIIIPANVTEINENPFQYCTELVSIKVDANNKRYTSRDANGNEVNAVIDMIDPKFPTLVIGCQSTVIPDNVKRIKKYAFAGQYKLANRIIPETIDWARLRKKEEKEREKELNKIHKLFF